VSANGNWKPQLSMEKAVAVHAGKAVVTLPPASAMVLTITE
jgi:hypothetical protein